MFYRLLRWAVRIGVNVFYRRIEVQGRENVPASGPVLLVSNHPNALIDPILPGVVLDRPISMTAKSTLFDQPLIGSIVKAIHVIPIFRRRDIHLGVDPSMNTDSFREASRRLAEGGAVLIFPEGISHSMAQIQPLRTGAARMTLECLDHYPGGEALKIVPVGLFFTHKSAFRSSAIIRFGKPIEVAKWRAESKCSDERDEVRSLTRLVDQRMREVTLNFEAPDELELANWTARTLLTGGTEPRRTGLEQTSLAQRVEIAEKAGRAYEQLNAANSKEAGELYRQLSAYRAELRSNGIRPEDVFLQMSRWKAARFTLREGAIFLLGAPSAAFGWLNHLPFLATLRAIAKRRCESEDMWATYYLMPGVFLLPLFYLIQIALVAALLSPGFGAAYALLLPVSGWFGLNWADRVRNAMRRCKTYVRLATDRPLRIRLSTEGSRLIAEVRRLNKEAQALEEKYAA